MIATACTCSMSPITLRVPQLHSTAVQSTPMRTLPHHHTTAANWPAAAACSRIAPLRRTAACRALPGLSEAAILADVGSAAVSGLGSAIDSLVSSGGYSAPAEAVQDFQKFEPQMNPFVAVAALAAALPPIIFWSRIFLNARRQLKEDEQKELDRQERMRKLSGGP